MAATDVSIDMANMSDIFNRIDNLTEESEFVTEITKKHWKLSENVSRCSNRLCKKQFSLLERHHHCRKCGDVFCASCLQCKRRLNLLAHYDPQGQLYKVCQSCYEQGQSVDGVVRDMTTAFVQLRQQAKNLTTAGDGVNQRFGQGWRRRFNFDSECKRLMDGFKGSVGRSELSRTLTELRSMVSVPDWQKSSSWLQEVMHTKCQNCCGEFGLLHKRHHCKICGLALCKSCSTTDLLVYFTDDDVKADVANASSVVTKSAEPVLAIIKIVGCPEMEPEVSLYLRVCAVCREEVIRRQLARLGDDEALTGLDMLLELTALHAKFFVAETNVKTQLRDYQEIIDSLENNSRRSSAASTTAAVVSGSSVTGNGPAPQSNMRTLAKAQEDLTDFLAQHVMVLQRLKRLLPKTETQSRLLKNYIRAKCDFYMENMSTFRCMKKKLSESSPPEVLEFIQRVMDKNAIISAHLYLRQLVYETIHLSEKYQLEEQPVKLLFCLEQVIEKDVSVSLQRDGEDIKQHLELMKNMIRTQMKDHKLIRPSRQVSRLGSVHVQQIMDRRTREVLKQVSLQLMLKSANRSFPATKQALHNAAEQLSVTDPPPDQGGQLYLSKSPAIGTRVVMS